MMCVVCAGWMFYIMSCIFSCGIGQILTCCGGWQRKAEKDCMQWETCSAGQALKVAADIPLLFSVPRRILNGGELRCVLQLSRSRANAQVRCRRCERHCGPLTS
jgi:hypothetical protein